MGLGELRNLVSAEWPTSQRLWNFILPVPLGLSIFLVGLLLWNKLIAKRDARVNMLSHQSIFWASGLLALCAVGLRIDYGRLVPRSDLATTTTSSNLPRFTVPSEVDEGANLIPNIQDPKAVDPQSVCPGYVASNVKATSHGFSADLDLGGTACNVYGTEVDALTLVVEYQATDRLHVEILPRYLGEKNSSWFILPGELVPVPTVDDGAKGDGSDSDLQFEWDNDPSFSFTVTRKCTGDVIFSTKGTKLVFEDQFFEFAAPLPENYNLYGLGEVIRGFRLGNNLTRMGIFFAKVL
jgi:alpha-glucosidase